VKHHWVCFSGSEVFWTKPLLNSCLETDFFYSGDSLRYYQDTITNEPCGTESSF
jgi:hypothetical protein